MKNIVPGTGTRVVHTHTHVHVPGYKNVEPKWSSKGCRVNMYYYSSSMSIR